VNPQLRVAADRTLVECGAAVTGTAIWTGNIGHRAVDVVLRYRTQGRGDTDASVVARCHLGVAEAGRARFRLDVPPQGPVTYNGQLLRLSWQAVLVVKTTWSFGSPTTGPAVVDLTVAPWGWTRLPTRRDG
jgi:hypothetical protein